VINFHLPYIFLCIFSKKNYTQNHSKTVPKRPPLSPPFFPRRRSFLIAAAAFGLSWVKKGDGGLGLRWWWLRV